MCFFLPSSVNLNPLSLETSVINTFNIFNSDDLSQSRYVTPGFKPFSHLWCWYMFSLFS